MGYLGLLETLGIPWTTRYLNVYFGPIGTLWIPYTTRILTFAIVPGFLIFHIQESQVFPVWKIFRFIFCCFVRCSTHLFETIRLIDASNLCNGSFAIFYDLVIQSVDSSDTSLPGSPVHNEQAHRFLCLLMDGLSSPRKGLSYATTWGLEVRTLPAQCSAAAETSGTFRLFQQLT